MSGVDLASKNEYRDIPGSKGDLHVPSVKKSGSPNLLDPSRPRRSVTGVLHLFFLFLTAQKTPSVSGIMMLFSDEPAARCEVNRTVK